MAGRIARLFPHPPTARAPHQFEWCSAGGPPAPALTRSARFFSCPKWDLWTTLLDAAGARMGEPEAFLRTENDERESDLSPDGRWIAYAASEAGGRFDIYVRALPDDGRRWKISDGGGVYPRWSGSRSTLFFIADGLLMAAPYAAKGSAFAPGRPHLLSRQPLAAEPGPNPYPYSVSGAGERIVAVIPDDPSDQYSRRHVTLWVNALTDLRRRAPSTR